MATSDFTDDHIDELGARLRRGITVADRNAYQPYRQYLTRLQLALEDELRHLIPDAEVASRVKRVETVAAKLQRRPELALSQITDLAGCRLIVPNRQAQMAAVFRLRQIYDVQAVDDKSDAPKSGYRAVHLDIRYRGQLVEIQVQTRNQHLWQRVSEQAAGQDIAIKYGGGHPPSGARLAGTIRTGLSVRPGRRRLAHRRHRGNRGCAKIRLFWFARLSRPQGAAQ